MIDLGQLGRCFRTWTPRTCRGWDQRSPVDHMCWTPRAFPHVCVCKCGTRRRDAQ